MPDPFNRNPHVTHGVAETIPVGTASAPPVRRMTCNNPSPMTFTGTQSYLVGGGADKVVIDPGPLDEAHLSALLHVAGGAIGTILVTHSHRDHSPGAAWLAERTGAPILAFGPHGAGMSAAMREIAAGGEIGGGEGGDHAFRPDQSLGDGETLAGSDWEITALHTPGHLSNHLAFVLGDTGVLFTGDVVMGWATTLVSPPEGDMAAFMATLEQLSGRRDRLYLPGHGHAIEDPAAMLAHQQAHRQSRAAQILAGLEAGPANAAELAARIYTDVDPALLPAAARNVLATLLWKAETGEVTAEGPLRRDVAFRHL